jgi:soluble lytic murein transglycosylase
MRTLIGIGFLFLVLFSRPSLLHPQEETSRDLFAKAYALFSRKDLSQAEPLFLRTLEKDYVLSDYSVYFLGQIYLAQADYSRARSYLIQLRQRFPASIWSLRADLDLARILLAEKNYDLAIQQLRPLSNLPGKSDLAGEALYLMGQIQEARGDPEQAYSLFQELRRSFPLSSWAARARVEVTRLRTQLPEALSLVSHQSLWNEAELLFREREYQAAERTYRRLLASVSDEALRPRWLMGLANALSALRKRDEEVPILNVLVNKYPKSPFTPEAVFRLGMLHWNQDDNLKALEHFSQLKRRFPQNPLNEAAAIATARIYQSLNKIEEAIGLYDRFAITFPASPLREEAQWRLAWIHYTQGAYNRAYAAFNKLASDKHAGRYRIAALYWKARTSEKIAEVGEAKQLYLELLQSDHDGYYAGLAAKRLGAMGETREPQKVPSSDAEIAPRFGIEVSFHLARARELGELAMKDLALGELDEIRNQSAGNVALSLALCREYERNGAYARSVALANQIPLSSSDVKMHRYPLVYWELIRKRAEGSGLDPYLIVALIRQESLFDPTAVSPASAFGLMQLLSSTARQVARRLGIPELDREQLFDPDLNLTLGIRYLKDLLDRYANNQIKALAAYNAGERAVARWESQIDTEDDEEFVERLTYRETLLYIKLVLRNHRHYKLLYDNRGEQNNIP